MARFIYVNEESNGGHIWVFAFDEETGSLSMLQVDRSIKALAEATAGGVATAEMALGPVRASSKLPPWAKAARGFRRRCCCCACRAMPDTRVGGAHTQGSCVSIGPVTVCGREAMCSTFHAAGQRPSRATRSGQRTAT